jgi:hypothetical protein
VSQDEDGDKGPVSSDNDCSDAVQRMTAKEVQQSGKIHKTGKA